MTSFLLLVTCVILSSAAVVEIDYDSCSSQGSWSGSGNGAYGTTTACVYSSYCHLLDVPGQIERRFDTRGYSDIYMEFDINTSGYESSDFCWVLYSIDNGVNWIEVNKYTAENEGSNRYIYFPPSVNDNYDFKIKFLSAASVLGEYCTIDGVYIYGTSPKNIPYDSSILIFEDIANTVTDADWTWSGNNNQGAFDDNCLATNACFQLKGGSDSGTVQKIISTKGYIHISVEFDIRSTGIDSNEYCIAWYTDNGGSNWYEIDSFDFTNDGKRHYFLPSSCSDNSQFGLRFTFQASSTSEICYIDIIRINGDLPTPSPTPPPTNPTLYPTPSPTSIPTLSPTNDPSTTPTTAIPTVSPITSTPTAIPTFYPSINPTYIPTKYPTIDPTIDPSIDPTIDPTTDPTIDPTIDPTNDPTVDPTYNPTKYPTTDPSIDPTIDPTTDPTNNPTIDPTFIPTMNPTFTYNPTSDPTTAPTNGPSESPTSFTREPTINPTEPNGEVSENDDDDDDDDQDDDDDDDNNNNKGQSVNGFNTYNLNMPLLIIITVCVVFICIATYICFWCLLKKKKKKKKKNKNRPKIEASSRSNTQQLQHSVMEMHKIDKIDKIDKTPETEINGTELFKVASLSCDTMEVLQPEILENVTRPQTIRDPNIDDEEEEEGSSVYDMGLWNNNNNNDDDDDDDMSLDDMYGENNKVTEGNNNNNNTMTQPMEYGQTPTANIAQYRQ